MFSTIDKKINSKRTIFVDFDDTIFIHKAYDAEVFDESGISRDSWFDVDHVYDERGDRNDLIYNLLKRQKEQYGDNLGIIGLTWVFDSNVVNGKHRWVDKNEPGIFTDMIGVSEKIGKIKIMNIYCKEKANGDKRSICLIDDDLETIKAARQAGYDAWQTVAAMQYEYAVEKAKSGGTEHRDKSDGADSKGIKSEENDITSEENDIKSEENGITEKVVYIVYEEIPDVLGSGSDFREYGTYNSFEEAMDKYTHSCANTIHKRTKTYKDGKIFDIKTEYWDNETKSFRQ